jgi:ribose transport system substrate-binding protein
MKKRPAGARQYVLAALAATLATALSGGAEASDNKIALASGGPHPYFAPWEQAAADATTGATSR